MSDKEKILVLEEVKKVSAFSTLLPRHFSGNLKWCFYGFRFIYYNSTMYVVVVLSGSIKLASVQ